MFLRNCWYVVGWAHEIEQPGQLLGCIVIGQPIVVWRDSDGAVHAMEDRCPHRHAALSLGRVEGNRLRCMYHGMLLDGAGKCVSMPLMDKAPDAAVRVYPLVERHDWLWIWTGDIGAMDETLIPEAFGLRNPEAPMQAHSIEYDAHYQLLHDNLCDLSHVDFVHSQTLQPATGASWSQTAPRVQLEDRAVRFERWFENAQLPGRPGELVDVWSAYEFAVPGIFIMRAARYAAGTAAQCGGRQPVGIKPIVSNVEQQAVTPISRTRTAYHYATGLVGTSGKSFEQTADRMEIVKAAFAEDRAMIEAQQKIWDQTPPEREKLFLPQDKGPFLMRRLMDRLIKEENGGPQIDDRSRIDQLSFSTG